jgi:RNA polymerase sigma-70 factor (ECF subfamily)
METTPSRPDKHDDVSEIVAQARRGDRQAFNRLVIRYQDIIVNLCASLMSNRSDGEDAAQETFIKAWEQIDFFRGEAQFSTWLHTIAVNTCRNKQRSFWQRLFRKSVPAGMPALDEDVAETIEIIDSSPLPSQELERKELKDQIIRALGMLPDRYRELIVLRDLRQFSYAEMAEMLDVPEGTIKSGIARARLALQVELKGLIDGF